jgi:Ca-activated chloride channel family protein
MRTVLALGVVGVWALAGCGGAPVAQRGAVSPVEAGGAPTTSPVAAGPATAPDVPLPPVPQGPWVGAAADSDVLLSRGGDAFLGVWVDVPAGARARVRAPVDVALVIDTSGSMEGAKIQAARASARTIVGRLADGDVLSVDTFSDHARTLLPPMVLTPETRARALSIIAELGASGSTNMFEGLELAEMHVAQAPADHPVRRIVMISDGQANVGPSSPQALGELAQRSLSLGAQVTSLGVGLDYDERTLDAIAERTSGRIFHVGDPREMTATLEKEIDLLASTVADQAVLEVVPAPGVMLSGVEGARVEAGESGAMRIPLGALFAGQHREALVRVRLTQAAAGTQRALASVRLKFRDPAENEVERVQEVLARAQTSDDPVAVAEHANAKTHAMIAMVDAARVQVLSAQDMGVGSFGKAENQLAQAERHLRDEAARTKDDDARKKLTAAATTVARARANAAAAPKAAPSKVREDLLDMNQAGMKAAGY